MNQFTLAVSNVTGTISAALDLLVVDAGSYLAAQLDATCTSTDTVDIYASALPAITALTQAQKIGSVPSDGSLVGGQTLVQFAPPRARYLYVVPTGGTTTGRVLTVTAQSNASGVPGTTAWIQSGNSFGATGVLGTNDAFDLTIRANGATRLTFTSAGAVNLTSAAGQPVVESAATTFSVTGGTGYTATATTGRAFLTALASSADVTGAVGSTVTATTGAASLVATAANAAVTAGTTVGITGGTGVTATATTGNMTLTAAAGAASVTLDATGAAGVVNVGTTGATARSVNVGTAGAVVTLALGSTTGASVSSLRAGTGGLTVVNNGVTLTWPTADATIANQALVSNAAGVLSFRGAINVQASTTNAQSIADGAAAAIVTTWTETVDTAGAFNAGTGVFTAPVTGFYRVTAELEYAAIASIVAGEFTVQIFINGALVVSGVEICQVAAANVKRNPKVSMGVQVTAGQTIDIRASQNSGSGANALTAVGTRNVLSITLAG